MKRPREKNNAHLKYVRQRPCLICETDQEIDAAHIRYADERVGKRSTGLGEKPDDAFTVPMCRLHHSHQHEGNEKAFWALQGIDPIRVALALWKASGDAELGDRIIHANAGIPSRVAFD